MKISLLAIRVVDDEEDVVEYHAVVSKENLRLMCDRKNYRQKNHFNKNVVWVSGGDSDWLELNLSSIGHRSAAPIHGDNGVLELDLNSFMSGNVFRESKDLYHLIVFKGRDHV